MNPPVTSSKGVDLGTSIMAVAFAGGVVLGADSRTSTGRYIANRVSDKVTRLHDRIYVCRSGSAADTQNLTDEVRSSLEKHALTLKTLPRVVTGASMIARQVYDHKEEYQAGIICAGWDDVDGGCVFSIPLGGALVKQPYAIGGSGSAYIYGFCDANFKENMTRDEAVAFVKLALSHAMSRDGSSGGVIRTVTITEQGVERDFTAGDELPYMG